MPNTDIDKLVKTIFKKLEEKAKIDAIADAILAKLGATSDIARLVSSKGILPTFTEPLPDEEERTNAWKAAIPKGAILSKKTDLKKIARSFKLTKEEIMLAAGLAASFAKTLNPGAKKITLDTVAIKSGIYEALAAAALEQRELKQPCTNEVECPGKYRDCPPPSEPYEREETRCGLDRPYKCKRFVCTQVFKCFGPDQNNFECDDITRTFTCNAERETFECKPLVEDETGTFTFVCLSGSDFTCERRERRNARFECMPGRPEGEGRDYTCPEQTRFICKVEEGNPQEFVCGKRRDDRPQEFDCTEESRPSFVCPQEYQEKTPGKKKKKQKKQK